MSHLSRLSSLRSRAGSKGLIALGAATLMIGGGVAVAANGSLTPLEEEQEEVLDLDETDETGVVEDVETTEEVEEDALEDGLQDDDTVDGVTEHELEGDVDEFEIEAIENEVENDVEDDGDGERSDTARRVHQALTGSSELSPGDEGFGQAVSERARGFRLGPAVSAAARGDDDWEEKAANLEPKPDRGNNGGGGANGNGGGPNGGDED